MKGSFGGLECSRWNRGNVCEVCLNYMMYFGALGVNGFRIYRANRFSERSRRVVAPVPTSCRAVERKKMEILIRTRYGVLALIPWGEVKFKFFLCEILKQTGSEEGPKQSLLPYQQFHRPL